MSFYEKVKAHTVRQQTLIRKISLCLLLFYSTTLLFKPNKVTVSDFLDNFKACLFGTLCHTNHQLERDPLSMNGLWYPSLSVSLALTGKHIFKVSSGSRNTYVFLPHHLLFPPLPDHSS